MNYFMLVLKDLAESLAINQPEDHILFLKTLIMQKMKAKNPAKVFLIAPPYMDKSHLAYLISAETNIKMLSRHIVCKDVPQFVLDPDTLARKTLEVITNNKSDKYGWIFVDFPETKEEGKALIKYGILPTVTFLFLPTEQKHYNTDFEDGCAKKLSEEEFEEIKNDYKRNLHHLKEIFKSSLKEVLINKKSLKEVTIACCEIIIKTPYREQPILFRLALIGARGSQRRTLAKLLQKRFNMVHVDMEEVINQARVKENELGEEIRDLDRRGVRIFGRIVSKLLQERLLQDDCLDRGYVLTNFPRDENDFKFLDSLDTPPNRVIFLNISTDECKARLLDRRINIHTGKIYSASETKNDLKLGEQLMIHPQDTECKVDFDHQIYKENITDMEMYCKSQCTIVNARDPLPRIYETVESVLMSCAPPGDPRHTILHIPSIKSSEPFINLVPLKSQIIQELNSPPETTEELIVRYNKLKEINLSNRYSKPEKKSLVISCTERSNFSQLETDIIKEDTVITDELDNILDRFRKMRGF